jgi:hypothetical protein
LHEIVLYSNIKWLEVHLYDTLGFDIWFPERWGNVWALIKPTTFDWYSFKSYMSLKRFNDINSLAKLWLVKVSAVYNSILKEPLY